MPSDVGAFSPSISPVVTDEASFRKDKNYRRYAAAVERAVSLFDTTLQEWADYISFLGRLLKALQTKPNGATSVPHTDLVAKRLAQCLDPRLPSGVHQKALEVYSYVFSILRKDGLSRDLALYLPGLSPILSFASLSVKPLLLSLFESHILLLDANTLLPALKSILLALLPGLEDETSEEFERTHSLLNSIKDIIGSDDEEGGSRLKNARSRAFWQSLFLATITSASRRAGALQYLNRNLPDLGRVSTSENDATSKSTELWRTTSNISPEVDQILSPEPGLLIRCFVAGLRDDQLLVQRGFLDLLVTKIPLSSTFLQQKVKDKDLELLFSAAASVVARRDMSLNRRLWAWFLGPESIKDSIDKTPSSNALQKTNTATSLETSESHSGCSYFESFGLEPLTRSLHKMIADPSSSAAARARPFRISLALMDRSEIGNLIIPRIFVPLMESAWNYEKRAPSADSFSEVLRSAHVFFDGVQSNLIWAEICKIVYEAMNGERAASNTEGCEESRLRLELIWFIISKFNVREEEMLLIHMPRACLIILLKMRALLVSNADSQKARANESLKIALKIAARLLDLIPERAFDDIVTPNGQEAHISKELGKIDCESFDPRIILRIYQDDSSNSEQGTLSISGSNAAQLLLQSCSDLVVQAIEPSTNTIDPDIALAVLSKTVRKSPQRYHVHSEKVLAGLLKSSTSIQRKSNYHGAFPAIANLVSTFEFLGRTISGDVWHEDYRIREIAINLIKSLWVGLSPNKPQHAVESTRCLWKMNTISPGIQLVESAICSLMVGQDENELATVVTLDGVKCFTTLWTQTNSRLRSSSDRRSSLGRYKRREGRKSSAEVDEMDMLARPLSLLLDTLSEPSTPTLAFTVSWLQSLPNIQIIMDFLVQRLQSSPYLSEILSKTGPIEAYQEAGNRNIQYAAQECLYHIQRISNIVKFCPNTFSASLMSPVMAAEATMPKPVSDSQAGQADIENEEPEMAPPTMREFLIRAILRVLEEQVKGDKPSGNSLSLCKAILDLLQQLLPDNSGVDTDFDLENSLLKIITRAVNISDLLVQGYLMENLLSVLKASKSKPLRPLSPQGRSLSQPHLLTELTETHPIAERPKPSPALLECFLLGLSSSRNRPILDQWVTFLGDCLPFYDGQTFQILIPVVDCLRKGIEEVFEGLRTSFLDSDASSLGDIEPINTLNILLNGLEQTLGRGHQQLRHEEANTRPIKSPELSQGFFGNMVSGVFASDTPKSRSATANDRLTVLICFKDSVRIAFKLWSWGDSPTGKPPSAAASSASFNYASIRLRNRARRLLEHLFAAEPLESMETLIEIWRGNDERDGQNRVTSALNLLHALDSSRPKNTIPTTFNALYSRTNPASLDPQQLSTLTSELSEFELVNFLVAYTRSIDDDALDEIWTDCMVFSRNVLGNPMPQRQILTRLLEFIAVLGEKIDHTNFGEQRRMRKEIGDLYMRLLAAIFTVKPLAFSQDHGSSTFNEKTFDETLQINRSQPKESVDDVITILASTLPNMLTLLVETDRIMSVSATISTQVLGPTFKSRRFPHSVTTATLEIVKTISKVPEISKVWKKDVAEAFNDSKFFGRSSMVFAKEGWMPIIRQWALSDKDRMPEILTRLTAPTSAGIMFGVGASSARLEADRKTQLNLRRIAFLLIAGEIDDFLVNVNGIQEKLVELSSVTASSSPSSITKAELYMVMRALILKVSSIHLSSIWPVLSGELFDSLSSLADGDSTTTLNVTCALQAAKLLDLLITTAPDDFQLREWLYITDSVDAVYRPTNWKPTALVDNLADRLDNASAGAQHPGASAQYIDMRRDGLRRPLLRHENIQSIPRDKQVIDQVLRPFLRQLSITAFESTYQMEVVDYDACVGELLYDLFDESTLV